LAVYLAEHHPAAVAARFGTESLASAAQEVSLSATSERPPKADPVTGPGELLVPLQPHGNRLPLFMVHPPGGIVICYQPLARHLGDDQPLYAIRARGLHGEPELPGDLATMAAEYRAAIQTACPTGPYCLGGWSLGGVVAYEMAQQLAGAGESVAMLLLLDTTIPQAAANEAYLAGEEQTGLEYGLDATLEQLAALSPEEQLPFLWDHARKLGVIQEEAPAPLVQQILDDLKRLFHHHVQLASRYVIAPFPGRITLMRPSDTPLPVSTTPDRGWRRLATDVDVHFVPGQHHSMVKEPHVQVLAEKLRNCLLAATGR
jgi:thioesterase domain-containing protein